ncbi:hypothetical protein R3P38DRAFT_3242587 [Favolaschia claudopus]|uniref:Uncharacterized protein n=1 Tax=Favolaschia claudopus TaxID=2862362 RepID=A0AAV9Z414_9AGAR
MTAFGIKTLFTPNHHLPTRAKARTSNTSQDQPSDSGADRFSPDWPDIALAEKTLTTTPVARLSRLALPLHTHPPTGEGNRILKTTRKPFLLLSTRSNPRRRAVLDGFRGRTVISPNRPRSFACLLHNLLKASTINGKPINRTGPACRARLEKLLDAQRREQTRSLQLTGTNQEVDDHPELMTHLVELVDAQKHEKDAKSNSARKKIDVETKAARDGAMKGLVRREALTDVSSLEGASVREKQGQRKPRNSGNESDKENCDEPKPKRRRNQLTHIVKNRNAADAKRLEQARKLEQDRHNESMALQHRTLEIQEQITSGIGGTPHAETNRSEAAARMQYEDSERRRIDAEHRAAEAERHASFLAAVSHKK